MYKGSCDPYAVVNLKGHATNQTPVKKNSKKTAKCDAVFEYHLTEAEVGSGPKAKIELFDKNKLMEGLPRLSTRSTSVSSLVCTWWAHACEHACEHACVQF